MLCQYLIRIAQNRKLKDETLMPQTPKRDRKADKSARMKARIIKTARSIFAQHGYGSTSLVDITKATKVTTGAIYHHFGDKKGLFQAVAEDMEQEILDDVTARISGISAPWDMFETGIIETLEICARPDIQRIVFREAPSV